MKESQSLLSPNLFEKVCRIFFFGHLFFLLFLTTFNYFDPLGYFHGEPITFTLRGNIAMVPTQWKPINVNESFQLLDTIGVKPIVLMHERGFVRFDYTDLFKGFSSLNILVFVTDLAKIWIWLYLSWTLWVLAKAIRKKSVFEPKFIFRLRLLAVIFPLSAILDSVNKQLFLKLATNVIKYRNHYLFIPDSFSGWKIVFNEKMLFELPIMFVILMVVQVFIQGAKLKNENDLTI
jgi:hypothetical protein